MSCSVSGYLGKYPLVMSNPDRQRKEGSAVLHCLYFHSDRKDTQDTRSSKPQTGMRQVNKPLKVYLTENLDGQSWNWLRKIHLVTSSHL